MTLSKPNQRLRTRHVPVSLLALLATTTGVAQEAAATAPASTAPAEDDADIVVLSPFIVDASKDQGYYAENTLAGSRMKANLADLASSISVVTKQQLEDTASLDINDVFRYEVGTEGSTTYTPKVLTGRSDGVADTIGGFTAGGTGVAQTNATANRVRGIGVPSFAINYFPSIANVPMDSYNVQSLEINRGPNSMLFGMGSPAGIVNQTTAQASVARNSAGISFRFDDRGSYRSSLNFNTVLLPEKLAIYGALLSDNQRFTRKPSYDDTNRAYGAITYKPFKKTIIRASIERYQNENRRPNTLTPIDLVSEWVSAGKPTYNALTKTVTYQTTGETVGPYILSSASPYASQVVSYIQSMPDYDASLWNAAKQTYNGVSIYGDAALTSTASALYVPGITWTNQARTTQVFENSTLESWFQPLSAQSQRIGFTSSGTAIYYPTGTNGYSVSTAAIYANSTWADVYNRSLTQSAGWSVPSTVATTAWKYAGVTDKSIYDWENINVNEVNYGTAHNTTASAELEQEITSDLHFSAGWMRQDFSSFSSYVVGQLNAATLYVDTSEYLPDGTANPYVGKVYVQASDPDQFLATEVDNHYRAMLAYTPDFTKNHNWTKWLGRHQLLGLWSRDESLKSQIRRRLEYVASSSDDGAVRYIADQDIAGWSYQSQTSLRQTYYLASPSDPDGTVTRSTGTWNSSEWSGDVTVYDYTTSSFKTVNMTTKYIDYDAGTKRTQRLDTALSAGLTSYWWNDRLVTTAGIRRDEFQARTTTDAKILDTDGTVLEQALDSTVKWVNGIYQTDTVFDRWGVWNKQAGTTSTYGGVFKPFKGWDRIERWAASGSLLGEFIRDFGLSYNHSDNFNAPDGALVDVFGKTLPKATGTGKDYGFQFSLFNNKLFAKINWFNATNENEAADPGSAISRLDGNLDQTLFRNWCRTIAMINMGMDPKSTTFGTLSTTDEEAVKAAAEVIWKQSYTYYEDVSSLGTISGTRNAEAKGTEVQLTYNPKPNWTIKLTGSKQKTVYNNVMNEYAAWYAFRSQVWDNAKASDYLLPQYQQYATVFTTTAGKEIDLSTFWDSYGYNSNVGKDNVYGYTSARIYYNAVVYPQYLIAKDLEGQDAPGLRKYHATLLSSYTIDTGRLKGLFFGGGERYESKSIIGYLGKSSGLYAGQMDIADVTKPVYDSANWYTDVWIGYSRKVFNDKARMKVQLNVNDLFEDGHLQVVAVNFDGSPYSYRIIDSRKFVLTVGFDY